MLVIRKAREEDCNYYFELVNDPLVRQNSIQNSQIPWEVHKKWFAQKLTATSSLLLVAEIDNMFLGQVRFDFDTSTEGWFIDYSIVKSYRGKGYGRALLRDAIEYLCKQVERDCFINAVVKNENLPSKRVFESLGFQINREESGIIFYTKCCD
ncbi:GNAT family N-acetyltransferase [Cyclobacterium xiamenense]|uniref:GNAT family N-acetyltransferase n=1 Tax=Cyclobacterium xiamenense TaxID=1297121 RepID=UPI0035D09611